MMDVSRVMVWQFAGAIGPADETQGNVNACRSERVILEICLTYGMARFCITSHIITDLDRYDAVGIAYFFGRFYLTLIEINFPRKWYVGLEVRFIKQFKLRSKDLMKMFAKGIVNFFSLLSKIMLMIYLCLN